MSVLWTALYKRIKGPYMKENIRGFGPPSPWPHLVINPTIESTQPFSSQLSYEQIATSEYKIVQQERNRDHRQEQG